MLLDFFLAKFFFEFLMKLLGLYGSLTVGWVIVGISTAF